MVDTSLERKFREGINPRGAGPVYIRETGSVKKDETRILTG